ncbi:hypothetical protein ILUMI_10501 [Ignelater luminosus]|uniref:C2H2-type domain-containing protein n=1 Tax=Ignelater luminosus TaxID=2038154 RepID=A0A8K0CY12_IGNLU|nr:hypothetical protein ILUMI_10501 [Ignelater luminosus]
MSLRFLPVVTTRLRQHVRQTVKTEEFATGSLKLGLYDTPKQARNDSQSRSSGKKNKKINSEVFPAVLDFSISESLQQQKFDGPAYACPDCGRAYKLKSSLRNHRKWECGKEPQFKCPYCDYKAKQKMHLVRHLDRLHKEIDYGVLSEMELTLEVNEDKE